jgi:GDP-L-fucose synthase
MNKDAKIFIAGHTGPIGSALLRRLKSEGYSQVVLPHRRLDLQSKSSVESFFNEIRPKYVLLAAGRTGGIVENKNYPGDLIEANLAIQLNVLRAARRAVVTKLILFGSSCMYPRECVQPMPEDILLSGKPEPTSLPYAIAKLAGVYMCLAYNRQDRNNNFIPVIPNSVYGPNDNFDPESAHALAALISRLHEAKITNVETVTLWGSGSPRREFIHSDDIADASLYLLQQDISKLEYPLNIGAGSDISIKELAESLAKIIGYKGSINWDKTKPDGAPRKLLDSSRIYTAGWAPRISLEEGLRQTYNWYLSQHKVTSAR